MNGSDAPRLMVFASTPLKPAPLPPAAVFSCTFLYVWVKLAAQSSKSGYSSDEPAWEIGEEVAGRVAGRIGWAIVVCVETVVAVVVTWVVAVETDVAVETEVAVE